MVLNEENVKKKLDELMAQVVSRKHAHEYKSMLV